MNAETASRLGFWGSEGSSWGCWKFWELGEVGWLRVILVVGIGLFVFLFFGKLDVLECLYDGNNYGYKMDISWVWC